MNSNTLQYPHLTTEENAWLTYLVGLPSDQLTPDYKDYYGYLMQKVRTPPRIQAQSIPQNKIPTAPQKRGGKAKKRKQAVVRKSDFPPGAWVVGIFILFLCLRVIYNEYQKPLVNQKEPAAARVIYRQP